MTDNVVPFPPRLRVTSAPVDSLLAEQVEPVLVEHGGRAYRLVDLMASLSLAAKVEVFAAAPRSGQAAWDEVVRRWPALADLIVAGVKTELPR